MLAVTRLEYITKLITEKKSISVVKLSKELNVSGETIRRDLKTLEKRGILKRTYGGAYLEGSRESDVSVQVRKDKLVHNKEQIAEICSNFVKVGDTVFLDNSTTSLEIAKKISHMAVTVITNSLLITNYLANYDNIRTIVLGGTLDAVNMCFIGQTTLSELSHLFARIGFVSCRSLSIKHGAMDSNDNVGQIRALAIENCSQSFLIADHTKFGNTALCKISSLHNFAGVITDKKPDATWTEHFKEQEVEFYYPE